MTFVDGWVCRSCWKPNRSSDTRCYRCKTERTADQSTIEANRAERASKQERSAAQAGRVPDIVSVLPATVFAWYGRIVMVGGILFLALTPLVMSRPDAPPATLLIYLAFAIGATAAGLAMRWASGGMRAGNSLAFGVALVLSIMVAGATIYFLGTLPPGVGNPVWMRYISLAAFGLSAILAAVGLLFSLRDDEPRPARDQPTTDADPSN